VFKLWLIRAMIELYTVITSSRKDCIRVGLLVRCFVGSLVRSCVGSSSHFSKRISPIFMNVPNFALNFWEVKINSRSKPPYKNVSPVLAGLWFKIFHQIWQSERITFGMKYDGIQDDGLVKVCTLGILSIVFYISCERELWDMNKLFIDYVEYVAPDETAVYSNVQKCNRVKIIKYNHNIVSENHRSFESTYSKNNCDMCTFCAIEN